VPEAEQHVALCAAHERGRTGTHHERRDVTGMGEADHGGRGVDHRAHRGRQRARQHSRDQAIEPDQRRRRPRVVEQVGPQAVAQLRHLGRRHQTVASDVADDRDEQPVAGEEHVEPVAADLTGAGGLVVDVDRPPVEHRDL
jgi:hypothetical protein